VPNVRLAQSSMLCALFGAWSMKSDTWSTTSLPMAPRNSTVPMNSTASTRPVAEPRRHPRCASQSTAGSSANDRNSDTTSIRIRLLSRLSSHWPASSSTTPPKNITIARGNHVGMVDADGELASVSSSIAERCHARPDRRWMPATSEAVASADHVGSPGRQTPGG